MITDRTLGERLSLACLRAGATLTTLTGAALLVATLATTALPLDGTLARLFPAHAFRVAAVLLVAGGLALFVAAARGRLFDAEQPDPSVAAGADTAWWGLALSALGAPALLAWQLRPLAALWRDGFALLGQLGVWETRGDMGMSGFLLAPLFAVMALPAFETLAAAGFAAACAYLLVLVALRSRIRLRALLVCATLTGAAALATLLVGDTLRQLAPGIAREIGRTTAGHPGEAAQALAVLERYQRVTGDAARALAWSWIVLALWIPFLLLRALADARARAAQAPAVTR